MSNTATGLFITHALSKAWQVGVGLALLKLYSDVHNQTFLRSRFRDAIQEFEKKKASLLHLQERGFIEYEDRHKKALQRQLDEISRKNSELTEEQRRFFHEESGKLWKEMKHHFEKEKGEFLEGKREVQDMMQHFMLQLEDNSIKDKKAQLTELYEKYKLHLEKKERELLALLDTKMGHSQRTFKDFVAQSKADIAVMIDRFNEKISEKL